MFYGKLPDKTYEEIKEEVVLMFEQNGVRCIPISGFEVASRMGVRLRPYSALSQEQLSISGRVDCDGYFFNDKRGIEYIYYNDEMIYERQNQTILHEVGHIVLGHKESTEEAEIEAKFFAKYAAAPPPLIHRSKASSWCDIQELFCLSMEASIYAWEYYQKWLFKTQPMRPEYETRLLKLFGFAA